MDAAATPDDPPRHDTRWVVGVDGSESSRHAARWAASHVTGRSDELEFATSWSIPTSTSMTAMSPSTTTALFANIEQSAHATVDELSRDLEPSIDVPVTKSVGRGGASAVLIDAARTADLLVVGSRGRGGFARLVLGSTSTQCATHSTSPVAVIPSAARLDPVTSIVVAFDGSANSTAALLWANHFAAPGSTIDCVSVWDTTPIAVGADRFFFPEASGLAEERFEHLVMRTIHDVKRNDVEVRHTFVEGQPRTILAEFAAAGDLLVVGARGHGAVGALVLGSVSTWLLHHSTGPMVIVPHPPDGDDDADGEAPDPDH